MTREQLLSSLTGTRKPAQDEILAALDGAHVVGVTGRGDVGKTTLMRAALTSSERWKTVWLDLTQATSWHELVRMWAFEIAAHSVPLELLSEVGFRDESEWSRATNAAVARFATDAGEEPARMLLRGERYDPDRTVSALMRATIALGDGRSPVLAIDHLEAPSLSFRHPIDTSKLLWAIRSAAQHAVDLRVLMGCRSPATELATGEDAAFFGDGTWIRLNPPPPTAFRQISELPSDVINDVLRHTGGHVPTTIEILERMTPRRKVPSVVTDTAIDNRDLANRTSEYARSLHRLGGRLLQAVAYGQAPYAVIDGENPNTIRSGLEQLHLAGLIYQPEDARWKIVDPRIEWWLSSAITVPAFGDEPATATFLTVGRNSRLMAF